MSYQQVYAEVAVDAPAGHSRTFSYSVPEGLDVEVGSLVTAPFGARRLQGIVFEVADHSQVEETRDLLSVSDTAPPLNDVQLQLARWISSYYMSGLFEAASLMLPPGGRLRLKTFFSATPEVQDSDLVSLTSFQARVFEYLRRSSIVGEDRLVQTLGSRAAATVRKLEELGLAVRGQRWTGAKVHQKTESQVRVSDAVLRNELPPISPRAHRQREAVDRLTETRESVVLSEARKEFGVASVNTLLDKGYLTKEQVAVERDPLLGRDFQLVLPVELTTAQRKAAETVREALDNPTRNSQRVLLEGVTGSGKTEVYLDAVRHCLRLGKRAIVMVPEIALTHQTVERFAGRFPGRVAALHSGLSNGERFDQWWKIQQGGYEIAIGARSAVFAPQSDLGLIVIDEEHEWTYKQHDTNPRYHTRAVALKLAELTGAVVLMGSASPDVGTYHRALSDGITLLRLPERIVGKGGRSGLARAEVVDMRRELREGNRLIFSRALMREMHRVLDSGSQGILFLNRRGSASFLQCRNCGFTLHCRRCDTPLTYHKSIDSLLCHYCGERRSPPSKCPECLTFRMVYLGIGTQAIEEEIKNQFPGTRVLRWDRDTTGGRNSHEELLRSFRSGEAQFLVGTQMIAKGLHFPQVTLVGVVSADVGVNVPDYRAGERTFQVLCQVAGRSGRGETAGAVIIQTYQPENYAIQAAAQQDYPAFYEQEIAYRREQHNPPFNHLVRLAYAHTNNAQAEREAIRLKAEFEEQRQAWGLTDIEVLGPTPAYPPRLKGHYRWQLILRGADPRGLLDKIEFPRDWAVDVDPVGFS